MPWLASWIDNVTGQTKYIIRHAWLLGVSLGAVLGSGVVGMACAIKFWAASATSLIGRDKQPKLCCMPIVQGGQFLSSINVRRERNEAFSAVLTVRISKSMNLLIYLLFIAYCYCAFL